VPTISPLDSAPSREPNPERYRNSSPKPGRFGHFREIASHELVTQNSFRRIFEIAVSGNYLERNSKTAVEQSRAASVNRYVIKFGILGLPAMIALWRCRPTGVVSKTLYALSWANALAYPLWLCSGGFFTSWNAANVLIMVPVFAAGFSLVLLVWSLAARIRDEAGTEGWKIAVSNAFMLTLWLSSLIAPN
jgi:hypothetical protein